MKLHPLVRALFWPASMVFGGIVRVRAWAYRRGILKQKRLNGIVISVGNLTVGGTGKTPMVLWHAERLRADGRAVGILIRGYRGKPGESSVTTKRVAESVVGSHVASDEVLLLAQHLGQKARIGAGPKRYARGLELEKVGVEWFVLDDGFQHLQLARDVDIVLIDATDPFGSGLLLPAGRLREPPSALARADMIVITRAEHSPAVESIVRRHTPAPVFYATTYLEGVRPLEASRADEATPAWLGKKVFAFCGIGNPAAFFDDVRHWGMDLAGRMVFRDHFRYTQYDAEQIEQRAKACGAEALVCTEKDVWNLEGVRFATLPAYSCNASLRITQEEEFWRVLNEILERRLGADVP
jgi:tetraacyldisaccharide 4'-kinase